MKRIFKLIAAALMLVYVADVLLKKFFMNAFYREYSLPETASYLVLFFAVGFFLLGIIRLDKESR